MFKSTTHTRRRACLTAVLLPFIAFASWSSLNAQSIQGTIFGTVTDSTESSVPGATVQVTNRDGNRTQTVKSDTKGHYEVLDLVPGPYEVTVSKNNFATATSQNLSLSARQQLRVDIALQVGAVTQTVSVNGSEAGAIATDTPAISASFDSQEVLNLPANYRGAGSTSPLNLIQALPGVQADSGGFPPQPSANGYPSINFSIQGGLPSQSETTIDGISAQNVLSNTPFSDAFPSAESISEIRVDGVSNNAEFGQPGEITTVTKNGTNSVHGAAFWYFQSSALDATPYGSVTKPAKHGNDFGASVGGPVVIPGLYNGRNKTFFFGTYEGFKYPQSETLRYLVPTDAMKQGNFSQESTTLTNPFAMGAPYAGNIIPVNASAAAFQKLFPSPNVGDLNSASQSLATLGYNYSANVPNNYSSQQFDLRGDQYLGSKGVFFSRYTQKNISLLSPNNLLVPESTDYDRYDILIASFTYSFRPSLVNEFRFGFTRDANGQSNPLDGAAITNAAALQGIGPTYPFNGLTSINFNQFTSLNASHLDNAARSSLFQYTDNLSWVKGNHSFKFGGDAREMAAYPPIGVYGADNYGTFSFNGQFSGNEYADFLLGLPNNTVLAAASPFQGRTAIYAGYAQDNWKATSKLTLVYGLRYEIHPPYYDPNGDIGNFNPNVPHSGEVIYPAGKQSILSPGALADFNACPTPGVDNPYATGHAVNGVPCTPVVSNTQAGLPSGLRRYQKARFDPRFGFAWRVTNSTVLRGGFGYYNITTLGSGYYSLTATLQSGTRQFNNSENTSGPSYVWPATSNGGNGLSAPQYGTAYFGTGANLNWTDPYSLQWNMSLDHDFGHGTGLRLSYIALRSNDLVWQPNANDMSYSSTTPAVSTNPSLPSRPLSDRPFPNWGTVNLNVTGAQALYNALQIEGKRRFTAGLEFDSTYTYAKNMADDQGTDTTSFASENGANRATYSSNRELDYGNVYGTRRNRWITTAVYDLPFAKGRAIIGGWRVSGIYLLQSGPWLTPYIPGGNADPSGTGSGTLYGRDQHPDLIGNPVPANQNRNNWITQSAFACPSNSGYTASSYAGNPCTVGASTAPIGRFGTSGVGDIQGPGTNSLSVGLSKTFNITERLKLRAEGTFTNVLNHTNLADPILDITNSSFGKITAARGSDFGGNRTGQVSLRAEF